MTTLSDSWHRPINYLRISVTDRCNLRCTYCMPPEGVRLFPHEEILTYEEIATVARVAADLGISKVRLTGGEPLVRLHLDTLVRMLAKIPGIDDISLTTNGVLLEQYAAPLQQAGLKRVNISLDSLKADRFALITRFGKLADALQGIEAARKAGLNPVKINMVVMRGVNDDEVIDFARRTVSESWHVRFIELMPFGVDNAHEGCSRENVPHPPLKFVPVSEIKERLNILGKLEPYPSLTGNGPAKYFRLPGASGTVGFISPVSEHFCVCCNRLRLTADGKLRPCLLSDEEIDLRRWLRDGASTDIIKQKITEAVLSKPKQHNLPRRRSNGKRFMSQVGG